MEDKLIDEVVTDNGRTLLAFTVQYEKDGMVFQYVGMGITEYGDWNPVFVRVGKGYRDYGAWDTEKYFVESTMEKLKEYEECKDLDLKVVKVFVNPDLGVPGPSSD